MRLSACRFFLEKFSLENTVREITDQQRAIVNSAIRYLKFGRPRTIGSNKPRVLGRLYLGMYYEVKFLIFTQDRVKFLLSIDEWKRKKRRAPMATFRQELSRVLECEYFQKNASSQPSVTISLYNPGTWEHGVLHSENYKRRN